jgi:hypothetical protein
VTLARVFPLHVDLFLPSFSHSLEPRPSLQWLCNAALACHVLLPLGKAPQERGGPGAAAAEALVAAWGSTGPAGPPAPSLWTLPPSATKAALTRGVLHANKLVAFVTLDVVLCGLRRLGAVVAGERRAGAGHRRGGPHGGAVGAAVLRLPEVQTLIKLVQHEVKGGSGASAGAGPVFARSLLLVRVLTVLRLYSKYLPTMVVGARFDLLNLFDDAVWRDDLVLLEVCVCGCGCGGVCVCGCGCGCGCG